MLVRFLLFCGLCAVASSTLAMTLYRSTDARGVVFFSDQKTPGAQAFVFQERRVASVKRQALDPQPPRHLRPAQFQRYALPWRGGPFRLTQGPGGTSRVATPWISPCLRARRSSLRGAAWW